MPHLVTPDTVRVAVTYTHSTEPIQCELTFALQDASGLIMTDPSTTAAAVYTAAAANWQPQMAPEVVLNGVIYEDVRTIPFGGLTFSFTDVPGTFSGGTAPIPTDSCLAVSRLSGSLGRSARGRVYWPIWDQAELAFADEVDPTHAAAIVTALEAFSGALETALPSATLGMISQQTGGVVRGTGLFVETLAWAIVDNHIDSQRRRLVGRGR
jgi:hypothetical protein